MAGGFGLMLTSYFGAIAPDGTVPWSDGLLIVAAYGNLPGGGAHGTNQWPVQVRLIELPPAAESLINALGVPAERKRTMRAQLGELLVAVPESLPGLDANLLESGRLPWVGQPEVVAGCQVTPSNQIVVDDQEFRVVGRLKRGAVAWADSYLLLQHSRWQSLFRPGQAATYQAMAQSTGAESVRSSAPKEGKSHGNAQQWARISSSLRVSRAAYVVYVGGLALLFIGGSGLFIVCLRIVARMSLPAVLGEPLREIAGHGRLLWSLHLGYFALVILGALVICEFPTLQKVFEILIYDQLTGGVGPLGLAGRAYASGNVGYAAAVTFVVNFALGTLLCVTLPSLLPGAAVPIAGLRALLWGILAAPVGADMARGMLPHSFTLWLEGEGYILAAVFGLLIPLALFRPQPGQSVGRRYLRAARVNLKGLAWLVLLVAAIYEALEVILIVSRG